MDNSSLPGKQTKKQTPPSYELGHVRDPEVADKMDDNFTENALLRLVKKVAKRRKPKVATEKA